MGLFNVSFYILLLCSNFPSVNVCEVKYTKQPTDGHRCVASSNSEVSLRQDRPQCIWRCLKLQTCRYINHNYDTGQCDLGLDKCESLVPAVGVAVSVFGPPRDTCVLWSSRQEHEHVPVEVQYPGATVRHLARIKTYDSLLVGKFLPENGIFFANNEGENVGPIHEADQDIEILTMDPACTLTWMPYTAGGLLPVGAISGGLLPDGSITYVCRVTQDGSLTSGYHNTEAELAFYQW